MKHALTFLAMILVSTAAHAGVTCSISSGQTEDMVFGHLMFRAEITAPIYLLVAKDNRSVQQITLSQINTYAKWRAINGQSLVTLGAQQRGIFGITVGRVNLAKPNMLPIDAMVLGTPAEGQDLALIAPQHGLSINCSVSK